ncbi:RCC1 domain-containing protein [Oceanisphaera sp. W20_SRM_FM3]|uniref:RCC1 domain-containing protein n=1 Tax=Oceanisphaera sp. W20_SRM_FM3 TaxID=3240267 RepID=UPI003F99C594
MNKFLNNGYHKVFTRWSVAILLLATFNIYAPPVSADSSSPLLAAYYDNFLAICGTKVYAWSDFNAPQESFSGVIQVGVGKRNRYALTDQHKLLVWEEDPTRSKVLMENVKSFYAGKSGLFVIRNDDSLWNIQTKDLLGFGENLSMDFLPIARNVITASIGDSANYYVTRGGALLVQGLAHRGQYGDGKLTSTDDYIQTSEYVVQVASHTGHALVLKQDGSVWGTGGNIYGPLGHHGYGDKATQWGRIMDGANAIATGSSHSLAITPDGSLWVWGRNESLEPRKVMSEVIAVAAGSRSTIALAKNALWQWNTGGNPKRIMSCR